MKNKNTISHTYLLELQYNKTKNKSKRKSKIKKNKANKIVYIPYQSSCTTKQKKENVAQKPIRAP